MSRIRLSCGNSTGGKDDESHSDEVDRALAPATPDGLAFQALQPWQLALTRLVLVSTVRITLLEVPVLPQIRVPCTYE